MTALSLHRRALLLLLFLAGVVGVGCGGTPPEGDPTFAEAPLTTVTSDAGKLHVSVWTSPDQPPARGFLTLKLLVTDATSGLPVNGLSFEIVPEMPSMGHGTPDIPKTEPAGDGEYLVSDVNLFMAGRWELRITIAGSVTDVAIVQIDVS